MGIPTWVIVTGAVMLYFLIGIASSIVAAYREGRGGDPYPLFGPVSWTLCWPFAYTFSLVFFVLDKYCTFLEKVKKYGKQSVMPPENECAGRKIS